MVAMAVLADRYGFVLAGLSAEETRTRGVRSSPAASQVLGGHTSLP